MQQYTKNTIEAFQETVWMYYRQHARTLPWRVPEKSGTFKQYKILVSEIMLQQTQVTRVISKYIEFIAVFPTLKPLAQAPLADVLRLWSGLGYNRRAKYLHEAAQNLIHKSGDWTLQDLTGCKGIGINTAAAVLVYSHNAPELFIETNIRTVYIHHFFPHADQVSDKAILPLLQASLELVTVTHKSPREWYWALMDYGAHLKQSAGNISRKSLHYSKQSVFVGSKREIRGKILKALAAEHMTRQQLEQMIPDERLIAVLSELSRDELITYKNKLYYLG